MLWCSLSADQVDTKKETKYENMAVHPNMKTDKFAFFKNFFHILSPGRPLTGWAKVDRQESKVLTGKLYEH